MSCVTTVIHWETPLFIFVMFLGIPTYRLTFQFIDCQWSTFVALAVTHTPIIAIITRLVECYAVHHMSHASTPRHVIGLIPSAVPRPRGFTHPVTRICSQHYSPIRQYSSRDSSGCLYAVIQTKSRTIPEQDRKPPNKADHKEAGTEQCAWPTLHPSEIAPTCRERPRVFPRFVLFLFLFFFFDSRSARTKWTRRILIAPYCTIVGWLHSFVG